MGAFTAGYGWLVCSFHVDLGKAKYFPLWRAKGQPKFKLYWVFPLGFSHVFCLALVLYGVLLFVHKLSPAFPRTYDLWITLQNRYNQSSQNEQSRKQHHSRLS